ncbi:hypothetical protein IQ231_22385 [Cuspidothrix issatschenkoi LEGE 03284]|uniref:hypothetical protein n=1 Tax=Cuspidothrix issatschenkoi TaxID=230752 RepID=UPI00187FD82D|nr:hypothetical protein [Cuspidothrix issatschenkoi]MBE9234315.1 hypothetical protein [Cuspidothrix issatschenkoi LEGE 03284]
MRKSRTVAKPKPSSPLGVVGMLRFIQQFEVGYGDYTTEKYQLEEPTIEDFQQFVRRDNQEVNK